MGPAHIAKTAGDHDGLVVTANHRAAGFQHPLFEGPKIATDVRTPEFIVEGGGAQGRGNHDVECRSDSFRLAEVAFPDLHHAGNFQIRYREAGQTGLRLGADSGRALIANLAARAGGRSGKRRNRGRMIVRLDLHQYIDGLACACVPVRPRVREESRGACTLDDGGVVAIGGEHSGGIACVGGANHCKQRHGHRGAVDDELGVEYLVPAMLRVRLREHHEFDVGGVALQVAECGHQVIDLVARQRQSPIAIGTRQRRVTIRPHSGSTESIQIDSVMRSCR